MVRSDRNGSKITYAGTGNESQFTFDALGRNVKIVEVTSGTVTSTKQFVWGGTKRAEERDAAGAVTKKLFNLGQMNGTTAYFHTKDHLGSVRDVTNSSGSLQSSYQYSPFGEVNASNGDADYMYALMYQHPRSALNLTWFRQYSPSTARWLSRDPLGDLTFKLHPLPEESADGRDFGVGVDQVSMTMPGSRIPGFAMAQFLSRHQRSVVQATNLYDYVENSPIYATDPLGLDGDWAWCKEFCDNATRGALAWLICMMWCMDRGPKPHQPCP